jgi:dimethylaniline monooxygenase (N-oxide forming)
VAAKTQVTRSAISFTWRFRPNISADTSKSILPSTSRSSMPSGPWVESGTKIECTPDWLGANVSKIRRREDEKEGWELEVQSKDHKEKIVCEKLILATGLASKPNWPDVPRNDFKGLVLHSKDVGIYHGTLTSSKINRVTVYGGCKSAIDTINLCILSGKKVDWVIRDTGNGPGMMVEARKRGYHGAIFTGRWKNILTPSIFAVNNFWYRFLHSGKSKLGTWLCRRIWAKASSAPLTMEPYKTKSPNIEKLYPETRK